MDVAKELMLWPGTDDYYRVGHRSTKYLVYKDNLLSTSPPNHFHDWRWINAVLVHLIFLARLSGRVLVLPQIFDFQRFHYAADHLDLESAETVLGGDRSWRESTFFANPRLEVAPDATTAVISIGPGRKASVSELRTFGDADVRSPPIAKTYNLSHKPPLKMSTIETWAIALGDDAASGADVLVFDMNNVKELEVYMIQCFHGAPDWNCAGPMNDGIVPRELALVQRQLNWCRTRLGFEHIKAPNGEASPIGYQPSKTCFVRLSTGLKKKATITDITNAGRNSVAQLRLAPATKR